MEKLKAKVKDVKIKSKAKVKDGVNPPYEVMFAPQMAGYIGKIYDFEKVPDVKNFFTFAEMDGVRRNPYYFHEDWLEFLNIQD